jgi:NitT/TauT family transport system substrate-binding protein
VRVNGRTFGLALIIAASPSLGISAEKATLALNWVPTADHSPFFYAKAQGWYERAGIDLAIENGSGSAVSAQRVGAGRSDFGIADMATAMLARGKGADLVAVMVIYANSPQGFYWLESSGIAGPQDFPGRKIGNPAGDASRVMWPAFAKQVGIDPASVSFVNVGPQSKVAALKSHAIDITSDFYNDHDLKIREFGHDLGFVAWRDLGLNPYGNSIVVNGGFLKQHRPLVEAFVRVSQKAFAACVKDAEPCLDALMKAASGLDSAQQHNQWNRVIELMRDPTTEQVALGAFDPERIKSDYGLVETYFTLAQPFDVAAAYTNEFLDPGVKMPGP